MLRAIFVASVVAFLSSSAEAGRSVDARIPTSTPLRPASPIDGPRGLHARFAMAAADTTMLANFTFDPGGGCSTQGWTTVDETSRSIPFWHVDDFAGANIDPADSYSPLDGARSLWCGLRAGPGACSYAALPGYGDRWDQAWQTTDCIPVTGNLDVSFQMEIDSEGDYDATRLEYTTDCAASYFGWTLLDGGQGEWDGTLAVSHVASYAVGSGPVRVRLRFVSDGSFSDEDGQYDSHAGPVVVDNLAAEGLPIETFEDESVGDTAADHWKVVTPPAFGNYFALFHGATLVQQDECARNLSCVWAAIQGSTKTYACGGFPQQVAVPMGTSDGLYIDNSIVSPPIAMTGSGTRVNLAFQVYRDLAFDNLVFYTWHIRQIVGGCPGPWQDRGFLFHGDEKVWFDDVQPIGDLIDLANATHLQVRLGVIDLCSTYCGEPGIGNCHSHAPLFDHVRVYRVDITGPTYSVRDFDMFQDTFPVDGTDTGIGRADIAKSIAPPSSSTILPGDSCLFTCSDPLTAVIPSNPTGLANDVTLAGKQVYLWVHVLDSGAPSLVKSGAALTDDPARYPFKDTQVAGGRTWTRIRCELFAPSLRQFRIDLNDNLFEAGDVVEFFFSATNTDGHTTYCSGSALGYVQNDVEVAAAAPAEFTILPLDGGASTEILYVDGMDGRGAQEYWDTAFEQLGLTADRYDVRGPSSGVDNRPSARVTNVAQQLNANYRRILWDCGDLLLTLGDGTGFPEKSNDYAMLNTYLSGLASPGGVYIGGDDAAYELAFTFGSAADFRATYIPYSVITNNHRTTFGVAPTGVGAGDFAGESLVIYGGCPLLNDFDVMMPTGSSTLQMSYGDPAGNNAAIVSKSTGNARVTLSGFSFIYIRDDETDGVMDRALHLQHILCSLGECEGGPTSTPVALADNRLEQNYPNPFNPQTAIAFSIRERTRVRIDVFDVTGARVRILLDEDRAAGAYDDVRWDGRDAAGTPAASGVYFYRLVAGDFAQTRKMVLLK